ncbi:hypothetical protein BDP67DRAFT_231075 [Colletotrichum lupini]|nr:hypothetical protein BDP67DRAFT_231075 [Colletotrichum lupini]
MTRVPGARIRLSAHCEPPNLVRIRALGRLSPIRHQNLDEKRVNLGFWGWNGCLFIAYLLACAFSGLFSRLLHSLLLFLLSLSLSSLSLPPRNHLFPHSSANQNHKKSSSRVRETTHRRNATTSGGRPANQHSTAILFHTTGAFPCQDPTFGSAPGKSDELSPRCGWVAGPNHMVGTRLPSSGPSHFGRRPILEAEPFVAVSFFLSPIPFPSHRQHNLPTLAHSGPRMPSKDHNAFHCFPRPVPGA